MKRFLIQGIALLALFSGLHAVQTRYLNDIRFDNSENFSFSNVTILDNGGLELSRDNELLGSFDSVIWAAAVHDGGILVSAGTPASLYRIRNGKKETVFSDTNSLFISAVGHEGSGLVLAAASPVRLIATGPDFRIKNTITLSNLYIWDLVEARGGLYVLTGAPAEIYFYRNGVLEKIKALKNELNLMRGFVSGDSLLFHSDGNTVYSLTGTNVSLIAAYDSLVSDMVIRSNTLYVATGAPDPRKGTVQNQQQSQQQDEKNRAPAPPAQGRSVLYRLMPNGVSERIFERQNARIVSLSVIDNSVLAGMDRGAGYFEIPLDGSPARYTGMGDGRFGRFYLDRDSVYFTVMDPGSIYQVHNRYARTGIFTSSPFDCGFISRLGRPQLSSNVTAGTSILLETRTGMDQRSDFWSDWSSLSREPGRYIQYRVTFKGDSVNTPGVRSLLIPYVHFNMAPRLDRIMLNYTASSYKFTWEAFDENRDSLQFEIDLETPSGLVRLNQAPIEENVFEINRELMPEGRYRIRISASDRAANIPAEARTAYQYSDYFLVDLTPPSVTVPVLSAAKDILTFRFSARDAVSPLFECQYSLNGGKWTRINPDDSIFDSMTESFTVLLPAQKNSGYVQFKITDIFGNTAYTFSRF